MTPIYVVHPNQGLHPQRIVNLFIILSIKEGYKSVVQSLQFIVFFFKDYLQQTKTKSLLWYIKNIELVYLIAV